MKSKEWSTCEGRGKISFGPFGDLPFYQCNGNGLVSEMRFRCPVELYWPRKLANGEVSQRALDGKIAGMACLVGGHATARDLARSRC
jgi:hypothetical protein